MNRALTVAAPLVLALAASAFADEYAVESFTGGHVAPPALQSATNKDGAVVVLGKKLNDVTATVDLPFTFTYFGRRYVAVTISSNGWLAFGGTGAITGDNPLLPVLPKADVPGPVAAPLWDDLLTGKGDVETFVLGDAPARTFVVAWQHMQHAPRATPPGGAPAAAKPRDNMSFEVLLHESTNVIEFAYDPGKGRWAGLTFTAGIQNETGTRAFGAPNLANTNTLKPAQDQRFTPKAVDITGVIRRTRPIAAAAGLGPESTTPEAVVGADVSLVRAGTGELVASARTGADGSFTLTSFGLDGAPTLAVDLFASGAESRVTDATGATRKLRIATDLAPSGPQSIPDVLLDAGVDVNDLNFRKALNIQQAAQRGFAWANAAIASAKTASGPTPTETFPQLEIRWVQGSAAPTGYAPATSSIAALATISDDPNNPDPYDDFVVLREYAQHVLATIAVFPGVLPSHLWVPPVVVPPAPPPTPRTEPVAFLDGFSFWFAAAVIGDAKFIDTTSATAATIFDLSGPTPAASGANVAGAVAASLWDLVDPAKLPHDAVIGTLPASGYTVLVAVDQKLGVASIPSGTAAPTIETVFSAWAARSPTQAADGARAFVFHGTLPDDADEPNDAVGEETPVADPPQTITGLVLNPFNEDRFSFALTSAPVSVAVSFSEATDVDLSILGGDGQPIVVTTDGSTRSPVTVATIDGQAPGTYVVRVAWKAGPAAHYKLSIYTSPTLDSSSFPTTWTAGLPFSHVLKVKDGVPPVQFSLTKTVPGLTLSGGSLLVGTPTTAGDFPLGVVVTDGSGAGPQTAPDVNFHVNEALTLPPIFGVLMGRAIDVDLGRGGTDATWALAAAPTSPGFTLTPGDTLRMQGTSATATAFDVSASAVDSLGAQLAPSTSTVVVSRPLPLPRGAAIDASTPFGFAFDAIAGSRVTLDVQFSGKHPVPTMRALVDDRGANVSVPGASLFVTGAGTRIANVVMPRTARYFLVFAATPDFKGALVSARAQIRPPLHVRGTADITAASPKFEARVTAIAGSKLRIQVASAPVPVAAKPGAIEIKNPGDADFHALSGARTNADGSVETITGVDLPVNGEYVVRIAGDGATTGPLVYQLDVVSPKNVLFEVD